MAEGYGEVAPTRAALLELQDEHRLMREGFEFLDEKRLQLAAEMLRELERYTRTRTAFMALHARAAAAFAAAVARHGLQGLQVYPAPDLADARLEQTRRNFLGVPLQTAQLRRPDSPPRPTAVNPSPEAEACIAVLGELVQQAAVLAEQSGNLHRLLDEYRKTERRARALEDVLIPEVRGVLDELTARLEEIDLEEAVRVRLGAAP